MLKEELNALDALEGAYEAEFKRLAKDRLRDYVENVTEAAPRFGSNAYVCPCCGSGSGRNGHYTPAFFLFRSRGGELRFKCHSCDATGDVFDLAGMVNRTEDFAERMRIVADFLGVDLAKRTPLSNLGRSDARTPAQKSWKETLRLKQKASAYILECRRHAGETDYFSERGLSPETVERFGLGYDPSRRAIVIPFTSVYYMSRSVDVEADGKGDGKHRKPAGLAQPLFNLGALSGRRHDPVFLTEAPLDAMSIEQSGGCAMALGGTSTALFRKVLDAYRPENPFVLALDRDAPGRRLNSKVASILEERGIPYVEASCGALAEHKDANAALMADAQGLREAVAEEIERACALNLAPDRRERIGKAHEPEGR